VTYDKLCEELSKFGLLPTTTREQYDSNLKKEKPPTIPRSKGKTPTFENYLKIEVKK
jgi:hypothetical protein